MPSRAVAEARSAAASTPADGASAGPHDSAGTVAPEAGGAAVQAR